MAVSTVNYFRKYQNYLWGGASLLSFGVAGLYLVRYQKIRNEYLGDIRMGLPPPTPSPDVQKQLDEEAFSVGEYSLFGIAASAQLLPEKFMPKGVIARNVVVFTQFALAVGFFYFALPKTFGDRLRKDEEIQKLLQTFNSSNK